MSTPVDRWARLRQWEPNAVLVKEVRQAVRSNLFLGVLVALLTALAAGGLLYLLSECTGSQPSRDAGRGFLGMTGTILVGALAAASVALLARSHQGREAGGGDLLLITTLTPGAIVRGRILSGLCAVWIILATGLPFLTVAYLLRGVDLATILWTVLGLAALGLLLTLWAVLAAACAGPNGTRNTILIFCSPGVFLPAAAGLFHRSFFGGGLGGPVGGGGWLSTAVFAALLLLSALAAMYAVAVFMLSPRTLNRARSCRLVLSALILAWWVLSPLMMICCHDADWSAAGLAAMGTLTVVGLITGLFAGDPLSRRVRSEIPSNRLRRLGALLFFNGTLPALLWLVATLGLLLAWNQLPTLLRICAPTFWTPLSPSSVLGAPTFVPSAGLFMTSAYLLLYVLLARWLAGLFSQRPAFQRGEAIFALLLVPVAAGSLLPWLIGVALLDGGPVDLDTMPFVGSLFAGFAEVQYTDYWELHSGFLAVSLSLLLFLNARWLLAAAAEFRRPAPLPAVPAALPATAVQVPPPPPPANPPPEATP